ncbi:PD-(D/E)XK nuclease domain-containing protein [Denitratimonas sp. CY0512]|uniref:PD-(D/E)XK nuclease domain-containing protein n=1 Tax=Denitratimonas sp. CY0512 TaxID=3131940 RepID=UPI0030AAD056
MHKLAPDWTDTALQATIRNYVGSGYTQQAPELAQFCHAAAKIIRKRRACAPDSLRAAPAVFVMARLPAVDAQVERQPRFDTAQVEVSGRVWFGSRRLASATGIAMPTSELDDCALFDYVVMTLGVGNSPAIVYDAAINDGVMRIYHKGMADPDEYEELSLDAANITLDHLHDLLKKLHEKFLETPTASESQRDLWEDRAKWHPVNESEKAIQKILYIALNTHLMHSSLHIKQEDTTVMGRCDFILKEQDPVDSSKWTHHAIIELKVLKDFTHTGSPFPASGNKKAVTEGLDQARDYRSDHACRLAALSCYDMRKAPNPVEAIAHEVGRAKREQIGLWVWPIYNQAKAARTSRRAAGVVAVTKGVG